jgi:hypothetical protein
MAKWLAPVLGGVALVVAAAVGAVVWAQSGGSGGTCDRTAMAAQMRNTMTMAEQQGHSMANMPMPAHCNTGDMAAMMPEVSRTWHMMPDGTMMQQPSHMGGAAAGATPTPSP